MSRINDILLFDKDDELFNTYESKEVIGQKIYESFIKLYVENKGFPIDASEKSRFGTITDCMGLSTLLEFDAMNVDISGFNKEFTSLITAIFNRIYPNLIFDASPYLSDSSSDLKITSFVETASKICIVMVDLREYAIKSSFQNKEFGSSFVLAGHEVNSFIDLRVQAERLLIDSMKLLTDACLRVDEDEIEDYEIDGKVITRSDLKSSIEYRGWAFQRPEVDENEEYDTSIYFTYHATNAFIYFFNAFAPMFEKELSDIDYKPESLSAEERDKAMLDSEFFSKNKELIFVFREMVGSTGRYIDSILKKKGVDISFDYIRNGFVSISSAKIFESQKSNYVIDTLFVLAILINAGIDEDYEYAGQLEYFYNQIQYSLTNIKKIYNILKRNNKEDLIDSYELDAAMFSEKYPSRYNALIQKLRNECANIAVYDLVPLLCNTYAIISEYLVKYPQKEMIDNLELIMDNRAEGNRWYWDKDGFNINNNLYYIFALENFYDYYQKYELPLSGKEKEYNEIAKTANRKLEQRNAELMDVQAELVATKQALDDKQSALDAEVRNIAEKLFDSKIISSIESYMQSMIDDCAELSVEIAARGTAALKEALTSHPRAATLLKVSTSSDMPHIVSEQQCHLMDDQVRGAMINRLLLEGVNQRITKSFREAGEKK